MIVAVINFHFLHTFSLNGTVYSLWMALNILEIGMNHNIALISSFWAANRSCMEHHHMLETQLEMFISIRARYLGDKLIFKVDIS